MTATVTTARSAVTPPSRRSNSTRRRLARLERPLLAAGLGLITVHLLDLALSGPETTLLGVLLIIAAPLAALWLQPHVTRATRFALAAAFGLGIAAIGAISNTLHLVTSGPAWTDATGVGFTLGGLLLATAGIAALAAPRRPPRRPGRAWRAAHLVGWLIGAAAIAQFVFSPIVTLGLLTTHAPRLPVRETDLAVPHQEIRIQTADGRHMAAWYIPSRNRAAVLLTHGSSGNRSRVAAQARLLARHGYGVLALDQPGNGESDGRSSALGYNAQPALDAAVTYLTRRPDVDPQRIAAYGLSLGAEVLLEAAANDPRIGAVVSDGAERAGDDVKLGNTGAAPQRAQMWLGLQVIRGISGMRPSPPLLDLIPKIAPRPVLLIAAGSRPQEIPVNRAYRAAAGLTAQLWEIPEAHHTDGLRARPGEYEQHVTRFLDRALPQRASS